MRVIDVLAGLRCVHEIEVSAEFHRLLLLLGILLLLVLARRHRAPLARPLLQFSRRLTINTTGITRTRHLLGRSMRVVMSRTARHDSQAPLQCHEHRKSDQDTCAQQKVPIRLDEHEFHTLTLHLTEEDLRQEVEDCVAHKPPDGKGDHQRQGGRVDIGRT